MLPIIMTTLMSTLGAGIAGAQTPCQAPSASVAPDAVKTLVSSYTSFTLDLYAKLGQQNGNLFLSPYSIETALAMTLAGAKGDTASQMRTALHVDLADDALAAANGALIHQINCRPDAAYDLVTANAFWGQDGYRFRPNYLSLLGNSFAASIRTADFAGAPEASRSTINDWVATETHDKIKNLIPSGALSSQTRLVLTNAIYYKGAWLFPFQEQQTANKPFWTSGLVQDQVPTMATTGHFAYAETSDYRALSLPLLAKDGEAAVGQEFIVILPKERTGLAAVEAALTPASLGQLQDSLRSEYVHLQLPKFRFAADFSLKDTLAALGMDDAFDPAHADFTGMYEPGEEPLYLSDAFHKGYVDVNEKGIEAAAATAVVAGATSVPTDMIEFAADHPFLFLIVDKDTQAVLFLGRLADPRSL